jgi:N-acetylglucosaminyldiphosphoundecaprenol N-acetyl-beta-D-mannosaminyltransferase
MGEEFIPTERPSVRILGIRINLTDYDTTLALTRQCISQHSFGHYICACPVHPIMVSQKDRELKTALNNSLLTVPDGLPVVWAARVLGAAIKDRVYGPNLMLRCCEMAEQLGYSVYLYGGKEQTLGKLRADLLKRYPRIRIAGTYSPPFRSLSPEEETKAVEMVNLVSPDILFVGLGAPKQEKWMARNCGKIGAHVTIGVGAAFDFLSGEKRQAPPWMQDRGLEWAFRLYHEPRRLWKRYVVYNPMFVSMFLAQLMRQKLQLR